MCIEVIIDDKSQRKCDGSPILHYFARGAVWIIHIIRYQLNVSEKHVKLDNLTEKSIAEMDRPKMDKTRFQLGIYAVVPHWQRLND